MGTFWGIWGHSGVFGIISGIWGHLGYFATFGVFGGMWGHLGYLRTFEAGCEVLVLVTIMWSAFGTLWGTCMKIVKFKKKQIDK